MFRRPPGAPGTTPPLPYPPLCRAGGANVVLAETIGSVASGVLAGHEGVRHVGLEVNANHLRSVADGLVTATVRPIHTGRTTQIWDIRIEDEAGRISRSEEHTSELQYLMRNSYAVFCTTKKKH